jgi:precorrin-6A/cobalt-precorrin-6A reductase
MRVLILGGTTEATKLCELIAGRKNIAATLSLAGRTMSPAPQPVPVCVGGFGGAEGLALYLIEQKINVLIDATHPFAERISANATAAAKIANVSLVILTRAPWTQVEGDDWIEVEDLAAAASALGENPRRVLLTSGRLGLAAFEAAPQHDYLIRTIDPPEALTLPRAKIILDRGPFSEGAERMLMRDEKIEVLVTKNSGGTATYGKIAAARSLGLPVVIIRPPSRPDGLTLHDPQEVMRFIEAHHASSGADRGV